MVTIQQTELKEGIQRAIELAKLNSSPVLVSEVHKIDHIDPFQFFARAHEKYAGERFFWSEPSGDRYLVGIGIEMIIKSDQSADRFFHVEKRWTQLLESAIIFDQHHIVGTGPTAFGGFSFDPLKEKSTLWSKFSHSLFHVPKFMLTIENGQAYLTTNLVCRDEDHPDLQ